MSAIEISMH